MKPTKEINKFMKDVNKMFPKSMTTSITKKNSEQLDQASKDIDKSLKNIIGL